jgi:hypothetical protein
LPSQKGKEQENSHIYQQRNEDLEILYANLLHNKHDNDASVPAGANENNTDNDDENDSDYEPDDDNDTSEGSDDEDGNDINNNNDNNKDNDESSTDNDKASNSINQDSAESAGVDDELGPGTKGVDVPITDDMTGVGDDSPKADDSSTADEDDSSTTCEDQNTR